MLVMLSGCVKDELIDVIAGNAHQAQVGGDPFRALEIVELAQQDRGHVRGHVSTPRGHCVRPP
jgi:hypothetical protein